MSASPAAPASLGGCSSSSWEAAPRSFFQNSAGCLAVSVVCDFPGLFRRNDCPGERWAGRCCWLAFWLGVGRVVLGVLGCSVVHELSWSDLAV